MNKLRSLVCMIVIFCTMSTISYAKSEVRRSETQDGTKEKPFVLSMGDGIIDLKSVSGIISVTAAIVIFGVAYFVGKKITDVKL